MSIRGLLAKWLGIAPKRPKGHPPYLFTDMEGRHYYGWEDFAKMPPARANEIDDILLQCDAAMSRATLDAVSAALIESIGDALETKLAKDKGKALARAHLLATEIANRPKDVIPRECYLALAAVCAVRQDEDPYVFDAVVQAEKMQAFREAGAAGHLFFTSSPAFVKLGEAMRCSVAEFPVLSISWARQEARLKTLLTA